MSEGKVRHDSKEEVPQLLRSRVGLVVVVFFVKGNYGQLSSRNVRSF